jgi:hypothetical protein
MTLQVVPKQPKFLGRLPEVKEIFPLQKTKDAAYVYRMGKGGGGGSRVYGEDGGGGLG